MEYLTYWKGKSTKELSRKELIEALEYAANELRNLNTPRQIKARAIGMVYMMKDGTWV